MPYVTLRVPLLKKRIYLLLPLLAALAVAGWYWRDSVNAGASSASSANAAQAKSNGSSAGVTRGSANESRIIVQAAVEINTAQNGVSPGAATVELTPLTSPPLRESLPPEQARIAELLSRRNLARSIAETANADDAQLNALSLLLVDFCMAHTTASAKAQAASGGPPPSSMRAKTSTAGADGTDPRRLDNARWITESCKDFNEGSGQSYADAALTRLSAKGSNAGLVFSELSPQLDYKALSPRQFSVITDALNEKNMALLELLGAQIAPALNGAFVGGDASAAASSSLAWQLALCQLGAYCGRNSLALREACWQFGACAGDDLASAVRAAMLRDGLTSTALDQQVRLFVKAINTHDPDVLGIRRK